MSYVRITDLTDRRFVVAVVALLALMGAVMVTSALQENDVWDEGGHLVAGFGYWKLGDFGFNAEHPPLGNLINATPLLALDLRLPNEYTYWRERASTLAGAVFLFRNREPAEKLLLLGRLPTMAMTLALGALIAMWGRRHFGGGVALVALALFVFDPNLVAHGRYITTDMIAALVIFLAAIAWGRYLVTRRWTHLIWAGLALGCALSSKFSALYLMPVLGVLYLVRCWQTGTWSLRDAARSGVVPALLAVSVVAVCYWPETVALLTGRITLQQTSLYSGLSGIRLHSSAGHPAYLLGQVSTTGWWYYFPLAFLLKTPVGTLVLVFWSAVGGLILLFRRRPALRSVSFHWFVLIAPPLAYFVISMVSTINVGLRHLLPVYPFLFLLVPAVLARLRVSRAVVALCLGVLAIESFAAYPDYLAFFNRAVGGPARGAEYLVDSNLDWGGDVKKLRRYLDSQGIDEVGFAYFGNTDVAYWGVERRRLPLTWETEEREQFNGVAAVSATLLRDVYVEPGAYAWLRETEPTAKVGYSIYVYDLRR